jgi:hypothetical protein
MQTHEFSSACKIDLCIETVLYGTNPPYPELIEEPN